MPLENLGHFKVMGWSLGNIIGDEFFFLGGPNIPKDVVSIFEES